MVADAASFTLDASTVDILDAYMRRATDNVDLQMNRISYEEYEQIADKTTSGRPTQFATLRGASTETVYVWPVADSTTT